MSSGRCYILGAFCGVYLAKPCHCPGEDIAFVGSHELPLLQALRYRIDFLQQLLGSAPLDNIVVHLHLADYLHQSCENL